MNAMLRSTALLIPSLAVIGLAGTASAVVTEPDGFQVPINQSLSKDYGWDPARFNATSLGLQNLFDTREGVGVIDHVQDAATEPATFSPLCGLRGAMVLRGGSCQVDFGWYCVDHPETIYTLVSKADMTWYHDTALSSFDNNPDVPAAPNPPGSWSGYMNNDKGFVPTVQMPPLEGSVTLENVRETPEFSLESCPSQRIGFAFVGNPTDYCPQTKYSEQALNEQCTLASCDGKSWVSAVIYQSQVLPGAFYVAFEDLPTSPDSFSPTLTSLQSTYPSMKRPEGWDGQNDGDFNDFVFLVQGIQCEGGGEPCQVPGAQGVCQYGVTQCSNEVGVPGECKPRFDPLAELCDELDNDCDGIVDEDSCPPGQVCEQGQCIGGCDTGEIRCTPPKICEDADGPTKGYCVDPTCRGVVCEAGKVCVNGTCVGGCDGVNCPDGQECILGRCIDGCAGIDCPENFVCLRGVCVSDCRCMGCGASQACADSGLCVDAGCETQSCAEGQHCEAGGCVDDCAQANGAPVACPGGVACEAGVCGDPGTGAVSGPGTSTGDPIVIDNPNDVTGGGTPTDPGAGTGTNTASPGESTAKPGCGCRTAGARGDSGSLGWLLLGLGLGGAFVSRRRRGAAHEVRRSRLD